MNNKATHGFQTTRFLIMTVDPVHVGTGGMRLGRVDNSIVREPGTRLPKIPGSALHGAIRQYAAYRYGKRGCAGQGGHCGQPTCPICYTFGFVQGEQGVSAHSGVVSIGDARILLFPVYSIAGPVWVTSPSALESFGIKCQMLNNHAARWHGITEQNHLNLGWLMLEKDPGVLQLNGKLTDVPEPIRERIVLVSDNLFSQVVNSNLEVRTSVSIDPDTGAAKEGALFTYEAIPRTAILWMEVIMDDYREAFPSKRQLDEWKTVLIGTDESKQKALLKSKAWHLWHERDGDTRLPDAIQKANDWLDKDLERYGSESMPSPKQGWLKTKNQSQDSPANVVAAGLDWAEHLGIGGMGTRGFGRIRRLISANNGSPREGAAS